MTSVLGGYVTSVLEICDQCGGGYVTSVWGICDQCVGDM